MKKSNAETRVLCIDRLYCRAGALHCGGAGAAVPHPCRAGCQHPRHAGHHLRHGAAAGQAGPQRDMPLAVLCHGFTGSRAGDGHFARWRRSWPRRASPRCGWISPGCGDSTEPFTAYTLSNMADDVESAILYMQSTYGTGPTALVGHSMGGRLASLYPQQKGGIAALVL